MLNEEQVLDEQIPGTFLLRRYGSDGPTAPEYIGGGGAVDAVTHAAQHGYKTVVFAGAVCVLVGSQWWRINRRQLVAIAARRGRAA